MNDEVLFAIKLAAFTIMFVGGLIGLVLRLREKNK